MTDENDMRKGLLEWTWGIFQKFDMFGSSIVLNHKGKSSFKTTIGGIVSILIYSTMISISIMLMLQTIKREN